MIKLIIKIGKNMLVTLNQFKKKHSFLKDAFRVFTEKLIFMLER